MCKQEVRNGRISMIYETQTAAFLDPLSDTSLQQMPLGVIFAGQSDEEIRLCEGPSTAQVYRALSGALLAAALALSSRCPRFPPA